MSEKWLRRIDDIIENIERIERLLSGKTADDFTEDEALYFATEKLLQNIGEAANHLPDDIKDAAPHIPWNEMRGMRNILVHGYHIVDEIIVWKTVTQSLTELKEFVLYLKSAS